METVGELRARADQRLFAGGFKDALFDYSLLVGVQPHNLDARLRVGDSLLGLGEAQRAACVYSALARHAAHSGYPLRSLVAMKLLSALEPQLGDLVQVIAQLYGEGSSKLGRSARRPLGEPEQRLPHGLALECPWSQAALVGGAERVASDYSAISGDYPEFLPPVPLFSGLPKAAFDRVLRAMRLVRTRAGDTMVRQGEAGFAFYVVARGMVRVLRRAPAAAEPVELARLGEGSIFGEMSLVTDSPRTATVLAGTDCDLLELDRRTLSSAATELTDVARALDRFRQERLLGNLMMTSPVFAPLTPKQRMDLLRRFTAHSFDPGAVLIQEGQEGRGLFIQLAGDVDVTKRDGDEKVLLATLRPGEVFGEISLIRQQAANATVTAATAGTVLFLERGYFQRLVEVVPEIRSYVESLTEERLMDTSIVMTVPPSPPQPLASASAEHGIEVELDDLIAPDSRVLL